MLKTLYTFLYTPFIVAFLFGVCTFLKNPIYIRRIAKTVFSIEFILSVALLFCNISNIDFIGINLTLDKYSLYLTFLLSFAFLLFSIISKSFINKSHRAFHSTSILLLGLMNILVLSDNIFIDLILLFWLFLIFYFLSTLFSENQNKKNIVIQLLSDLFWFLTAIFLIIKDFARYFVINDINFSFSVLSDNLYRIDDTSIACAFLGFLILIGRLLNLIPFCAKNLFNSKYINPLAYSLQNFTCLIAGCYLFAKTFANFNFLFYQMQDEIAIFLIINYVIFIVLTFSQNNMFKFLHNLFTANVIIGLFSIFSFEEECFRTFAYFTFIMAISYIFCAFIFMILKDKFKTDNFDELKRINDKTRLFQFFTTISLLNIASVPLLSFFWAELICLMMIFSTDYEGIILNIIPSMLIIGVFILALAVYGVIYKILIEPPEKARTQTTLSSHQIFVLAILTFVLIILSFCPDYIFNQIGTVVQIERF